MSQENTGAPTDADGPTVGELVRERWGIVLEGELKERFALGGWSYQEQVPRDCPACGRALHSLRRPYESGGRLYRYVAVVCPSCPRAYTLADLGVKTYDKLCAPARSAVPAPRKAVLAPPPRPAWPSDLTPPPEAEPRALYWCKVTDPAWRPSVAAVEAADDVRVILPDGPAFDAVRDELDRLDVPFRSIRHWGEAEQVGTVNDLGGRTALVAHPGGPAAGTAPAAGPAACAARDAFAAQWDALDDAVLLAPAPRVPVTGLVPEQWRELLPHPAFNPAQAAAVPAVLEDPGHLVVVAPTGAGKTPVGMVAALHAHAQGRKAAWLVPQRSLTDELDRDLEAWRRRGLEVVRLTGEFSVDVELVRRADIWIATTEKFEAICRAGSLRAALSEVGCLVVDEIHLLGDPTRGPVLEALLARVREDTAQVRIVGLSATVANADTVAEWLGARLLRADWRPTRLTWQLHPLPVPPEADWTARDRARTVAAVRLARSATEDDGSALVFCGSKRGVRTTALAVAADRGVPTAGVDPDDSELVEQLCTKAGVRLHYRDWPYKRDAERAFRERESDILVATSTVAAGVNLPARTVIVRDTTIGLDRIEVSMVQQMFGRAGRVGAGEREGWAFLLTEEPERGPWQARLAAGYTVASRIRDRLPDHLLAELVQGRFGSLRQAEVWWTRTLAFHQGQESFDPLYDAVQFLEGAGFVRREGGPDGDALLEPTALGRLTSCFMVDSDVADDLTGALEDTPVPTSADEAERLLIGVLSAGLPVLEQAPFTDRARKALLRALRTEGRLGEDAPEDLTADSDDDDDERKPVPGDLARAVLFLVANSPRLFRTRGAYVLGVPVASMSGVLDEAQRYLAWLGAQGELGTVHPWAAIVAADLAQRIRWRTLGPRRGAGRLLWMCEQMATPPLAPRLVPQMWRAARDRGIDAPDWPGTTPPSGCALSPARYRALLADRTTGTRIADAPGGAEVTGPPGATVCLWNGNVTVRHTADGSPLALACPAPAGGDPGAGRTGAAVFTRGDRTGGGWLSAYDALAPR
ncbi:DEAD/DEAH box helicase [Streptomyces sp. MUM 203J]|uniref:DEAD/DEAH box helicase n=1 Tax=Streptomyces sp. MUM 203J TaxID=2791990 RepID=UPI001F0462E9|nr:DEAD/DEAH box helicase [Streptomyces sp. MUM 203J]MCH0542671.1 DEAD/DEAH box helicase [Streptomyces sp. MUM 203J]